MQMNMMDPEYMKLLPSMAQSDPAVASHLAKFMPFMDPSVPFSPDMTDKDKDLMQYFMMQGMGDNYMYLGAPVKLKGQVVGTLCSGFMFPKGGVKKATPAQKQFLDKKAEEAAVILDELVDFS